MALQRWEPNLLKYFKSSGYNVMWWGKNDLLAADAWESSVTSAMSIMGRNYGSNPYNLTQPEYYYRCICRVAMVVTGQGLGFVDVASDVPLSA